MREILFRGKRTDNGEWIEGCFLDKNNMGIFYDDTEESDCSIHIFSVVSETIGQYTGLTDKNGKKIFEGDIVLVPYIDPIFKCTWNDTSPCEEAIVKYCNGMFYVEYIESGDKFTLSTMDGYMKIIGNIHDNSELLGGNG